MDAFVYVRDRMPYGLDEIEEALEEALNGSGEVTGSGAGVKGSNFDIEIFDEKADLAAALRIIRGALAQFRLPSSSVIVINEVEYPINS